MLWNGNQGGKTEKMRISWQLSSIQIMTDQNQLEDVECFNYLSSMITNDARCTCDCHGKGSIQHEEGSSHQQI
jgi:hypothetical protein